MLEGIAKPVSRLPSTYNLCAIDNGLQSESSKSIPHHATRSEICTSCKSVLFTKSSDFISVTSLPTVTFLSEARSSGKYSPSILRPRYNVSIGALRNGRSPLPVTSVNLLLPSSKVRSFNAVHSPKAPMPIVSTLAGNATAVSLSQP